MNQITSTVQPIKGIKQEFKLHIKTKTWNQQINSKSEKKQFDGKKAIITFWKPPVTAARNRQHRCHQCRCRRRMKRLHRARTSAHFSRTTSITKNQTISAPIHSLLAERCAYISIDTFVCVCYLKIRWERGFLLETRKGERAALASEANLAAAFRMDGDRKTDLAAALAMARREMRIWFLFQFGWGLEEWR